jgi:hypothetical protein
VPRLQLSLIASTSDAKALVFRIQVQFFSIPQVLHLYLLADFDSLALKFPTHERPAVLVPSVKWPCPELIHS